MQAIDQTKILLVGLANAGKTSIYSRFFLRSPIQDIENIKPTIYFTVNQPVMDFIKEFVCVYDLGGQKSFRDAALEQDVFFKDARIILFVVDVSRPDLIPEIKDYFSQIIAKIRLTNPMRTPHYVAMLHKFDPGRWDELTVNIPLFIMGIKSLLADEEITFHTSSIYDDSVHRGMVSALIKSLPTTVIKQSLNPELLEYAFKTISNLYNNLQAEDPSLDLYTFSVSFGRELGERLRTKWVSFALGFVLPEDEEKSEDFVLQLTSEHTLEFRLRLSLKDGKSDDFTNKIAHGLVTGMAEFLGFSDAELVKKEIKNDSEYCVYQIYRKKI